MWEGSKEEEKRKGAMEKVGAAIRDNGPESQRLHNQFWGPNPQIEKNIDLEHLDLLGQNLILSYYLHCSSKTGHTFEPWWYD